MNIIKVLKEENVGKRYVSDGMELILVRGFSTLWLQDEKTQECIEDMFNLDEIVHMDFEEIVDWFKVPVDAKVLVSDNGKLWYKRHFAKYENGSVHVFPDGRSSFTTEESDIIYPWKYAKLYEEQDKLKGEVCDDKRK